MKRNVSALWVGAVAVLAALAAAATPLAGQRPQTREGFWIGFGFGAGSARETCDGCGDTTVTGFTGFVKIGGTVTPKLLLAGDVHVWTKDYNPGTEALGSVTMIAQYYPNVRSGFFVKGGLGFADYDFSDGGSVRGTGPGAILGLGYDIRVARNLSITPTLDLWHGAVGDLKSGSTTVATGWKQTVFDFNLGVTFH